MSQFLAIAGIGSRRACDALIREGRVEVDGEIVDHPGIRVDPARSNVRCDGERVRPPRRRLYFVLNKPSGYVTTRSDEKGRDTVEDLLGRLRGRVVPVGRLDRNTEGLLLLTNDGELVQRLLHPKFRQPRTYLAYVVPPPTRAALESIERGIPIGRGERSGPAEVKVLHHKRDGARVRLTLREGKNREVRRIFSTLGMRVLGLRRIEYAGIELADLAVGSLRPLTASERALLSARTRLPL